MTTRPATRSRGKGVVTKGLPLSGVRIVDVTLMWAGPFCTEQLADLGAEVIKIEAPTGDPMRGMVAPVPGSGAYPGGEPGERPYNRAGFFNQVNRNKLSACIDLKTPTGKLLFKDLVKISDVVVDNFGGGVMDRLDLGYDVLRQVKSDIIMLCMPGFGSTGPEKDYAGYGIVLEPLSGLSSVTGYADDDMPMKTGVDHMDPMVGTHAAGAIVAALLHRKRTGKGQYIETSHLEAAAFLLGEAFMEYSMNDRVPKRRGNRHPFLAPHGCYPCRGDDRWVTIAVASETEWEALCTAMGQPEWSRDAKFKDAESRWQNQDALNGQIAAWTKERDHYEVTHLLQQAGVSAGAVLNLKDLASDPHLNERNFWQATEHPEAGRHTLIGVRFKISEMSDKFRMPAPCFGQDLDYVLCQLLGKSRGEMAALVRDKIVYTRPVAGAAD